MRIYDHIQKSFLVDFFIIRVTPGAAPSPTMTDGTKAETFLPTFVVSPAPAVHEAFQEADDYFSYRPTNARNSVSV